MDEARALLDKLMGRDRNQSLRSKKQERKKEEAPPEWMNTTEHCRFYLIDYCPHDVFKNTKSDLGPCKLKHDDYVLHQFEESPADLTRPFIEESERELKRFLESEIHSLERRVEKRKDRLIYSAEERRKRIMDDAKDGKENAKKGDVAIKEIERLKVKIKETLSEAVSAAEAGDMVTHDSRISSIDELKEEIKRVQNVGGSSDSPGQCSKESSPYSDSTSPDSHHTSLSEVCDVCGTVLMELPDPKSNVYIKRKMTKMYSEVSDPAKRFELFRNHEHALGRSHTGWTLLRSKTKELQEKYGEDKPVCVYKEIDRGVALKMESEDNSIANSDTTGNESSNLHPDEGNYPKIISGNSKKEGESTRKHSSEDARTESKQKDDENHTKISPKSESTIKETADHASHSPSRRLKRERYPRDPEFKGTRGSKDVMDSAWVRSGYLPGRGNSMPSEKNHRGGNRSHYRSPDRNHRTLDDRRSRLPWYDQSKKMPKESSDRGRKPISERGSRRRMHVSEERHRDRKSGKYRDRESSREIRHRRRSDDHRSRSPDKHQSYGHPDHDITVDKTRQIDDKKYYNAQNDAPSSNKKETERISSRTHRGITKSRKSLSRTPSPSDISDVEIIRK